jgi:hypothetical protein
MNDFEIIVLFSLAIQPPPTRSWLRLASPNTTHPTAIFTVMNYNILCDKYATRHVYGYCPSWALKWDYRRKQILDELRSYAADIIALQVRKLNKVFLEIGGFRREIDGSFFEDFSVVALNSKLTYSIRFPESVIESIR